jgi:hypothetical protein
MKEIISKISLHLIISKLLAILEDLILLIGGQAIPLDRCTNKNISVNVSFNRS